MVAHRRNSELAGRRRYPSVGNAPDERLEAALPQTFQLRQRRVKEVRIAVRGSPNQFDGARAAPVVISPVDTASSTFRVASDATPASSSARRSSRSSRPSEDAWSKEGARNPLNSSPTRRTSSPSSHDVDRCSRSMRPASDTRQTGAWRDGRTRVGGTLCPTLTRYCRASVRQCISFDRNSLFLLGRKVKLIHCRRKCALAISNSPVPR